MVEGQRTCVRKDQVFEFQGSMPVECQTSSRPHPSIEGERDLRFTIYDLRFTIYNLQFAILGKKWRIANSEGQRTCVRKDQVFEVQGSMPVECQTSSRPHPSIEGERDLRFTIYNLRFTIYNVGGDQPPRHEDTKKRMSELAPQQRGQE